MKTILIEKCGALALLMKEEETIERFIVARDYNPVTKAWYGGGTYFRTIKEAADYFAKVKKGK